MRRRYGFLAAVIGTTNTITCGAFGYRCPACRFFEKHPTVAWPLPRDAFYNSIKSKLESEGVRIDE